MGMILPIPFGAETSASRYRDAPKSPDPSFPGRSISVVRMSLLFSRDHHPSWRYVFRNSSARRWAQNQSVGERAGRRGQAKTQVFSTDPYAAPSYELLDRKPDHSSARSVALQRGVGFGQ